MLISITLKGPQAKLLPTLLQHQHDQIVSTDLSFGKSSVFFPIHGNDVAEAVLLLEIAPEKLLREPSFTGEGHAIRQFVHAKAYASSAFMAIAVKQAFEKTISKADKTAVDLDILLVAVESKLDAAELHKWIRPLGWQLTMERQLLDPQFPESEDAACIDLRLRGKQTMTDAMMHLQVLLTALDADHIFWIGESETREMIGLALPMLEKHPHRDPILAALGNFPDFRRRKALGNLLEEDDQAAIPAQLPPSISPEWRSAWDACVVQLLGECKAASVLMLQAADSSTAIALAEMNPIQKISILNADLPTLQQIVGQVQSLGIPLENQNKMALFHASPLLKNPFHQGHDAVVIESLHPAIPLWHRSAVVAMIFGFLQPKCVIWLEPSLQQFENWASIVSHDYDYSLRIQRLSADLTTPQLAIFDHQPAL